MIKNRWFKSTPGVPAEIVIAKDLNDSNSPAAGTASVGGLSVTIAGTPTAGDSISVNIGGYVFTYTVGAGDTTAALAATALQTLLNTSTLGIVVTHTGTTSAVYTLTGPVGTSLNGTTVTGTEVGSTFSAISGTNFSGGVNPVAGFEVNYKNFLANAAAGDLAAFWEDNGAAVTYGSTSLPANEHRGYFYAWKQADGTPKITTTIPAGKVEKKTSVAYFAGQADVWTTTLAGTISVGQIIHFKIVDTTAADIPYPSWSYSVVSTGTLNTDATNLRAAINAETIDKTCVASGSGAAVVCTFSDPNRTFKVFINVEVVPNHLDDESANTIAHTTSAKAPVGTYADVKELEKYLITQEGGVTYTSGFVNPEEFGAIASNVDASINYGILILKSWRFERGEVRNFSQPLYVIIALPTADLATLAGL